MIPPIETVTSRLEAARMIQESKTSPVKFAEYFLGYDKIFDYNKQFLECPDRFIVLRYGRQTGKTQSVSIKAMHFSYFAPIMAPHIDDDIITTLCISHSQKQADIIFGYMMRWARRSKYISENITHETKSEVTFKCFDGSKSARIVSLPTGDRGDSIRGFTAALQIADEAAYIPKPVFSALLPAGAAVRAKVFMMSTPRSKTGMFYDVCEQSHTIYEQGKKKVLHEPSDEYPWTQFHVSAYDTPNHKKDAAFLRMVEGMSGSDTRSEFAAEFLDAGASLIPTTLIEQSMEPAERGEIDYYCLGVDTSGTGDDETVLLDIAVDKNGKVWPDRIYTEVTSNQIDLARTVETKHNERGYKHIYLDSTGIGQSLVDACNKRPDFLPVRGVNFKADKVDMFTNLVMLFEQKRINFTYLDKRDKKKMKYQLQGLQRDYGQYGDQALKIRSEENDDYPDALGLACFGLYIRDRWKVLDAEIMDPQYQPRPRRPRSMFDIPPMRFRL